MLLYGLMVMVVLTLLGLGIQYYMNQSATQPFNMKVIVFGKKGKHDLILKEQGKVILKLPEGYAPRIEKINENGEVIFEKLDAELLGKTAPIYIQHNQPYQSLIPDSLYQLQREGVVELQVQLNHLQEFTGYITASNALPLAGVKVSIHPKVYTLTDSSGQFVLNIPVPYQKKFQPLTLYKAGYNPVLLDSITVHTQQSFNYTLKNTPQ